MTGGGFGGSAIALVNASAVDEVTLAVATAFDKHGFAAPGDAGGRRGRGRRPHPLTAAARHARTPAARVGHPVHADAGMLAPWHTCAATSSPTPSACPRR